MNTDNITKFVADAIEGDWGTWKSVPEYQTDRIFVHEWDRIIYVELVGAQVPVSEILLDPLAWQAVGKMRGWGKRSTYYMPHATRTYGHRYRFEMHRFIDQLAEGKNMDEALEYIK